MKILVIKISLLAFLDFFMSINGLDVFSGNKFPLKFKKIYGSSMKSTTEDIYDEKYLQYPRNNNEARKKILEKWRIYYTCLKEDTERKKPEIHHLLEGQFTEFTCDICQKPFQYQQNLEWKYKPLFTNHNIVEPQYLDLAPGMTITNKNSLQIFNAVKDFEGLYVCFNGRDPVSVYILEISKNDTMEKVNMLNEEPLIIKLEGAILQAYTKWNRWTECSACGVVGKKYKYGTCMISLKKPKGNQVPSKGLLWLLSKNAIFENIEVKRELSLNKNSTSEGNEKLKLELEIIQQFEAGIPCASPYMPKGILELFNILNKALKVMVKFCLVPCPEPEIFEVLDSAGRIIEKANNSAGIYSMLQKMPQLSPDIDRISLTEEFGKEIIIQCPGTTLSNIPITWKINKKIIFSEIIANESDGRFTVDLLNRIHIKKLRLRDNHIYSCWQRDKLVGTIHLNVNKNLKIGFNHHITLIGMLAVIGTFVFIGGKILARELKMSKKKT